MKDNVNRIKRQTTRWKKISVNHVFDKRLVSRICEELSSINSETKKETMQLENGQRT